MHAAGASLTAIRDWSFAQRESGRPVPYLAVLDATGPSRAATLAAAPTAAQPALRAFFAAPAPGCKALPRYTLTVGAAGVRFLERLGRGKDNVRQLV